MYEIKTIKRFRKKYQKLVTKNRILKDKIVDTIETLKKDPFYKSLKTHKVITREYGEVFSSFVTGDLRIIWAKIKNELILLLLDIGGHSGKKSVY